MSRITIPRERLKNAIGSAHKQFMADGSTHVVIYDLNDEKNYSRLEQGITKHFSGNYKADFTTTWFINAGDRSSQEVINLLKPYIDEDDELLVARVSDVKVRRN